MALKDIFKDSNDINEKNVVGFLSFAVMVVIALADVVAGFLGIELEVQSFIYNSFVIITLGSFGVDGVQKVMGKKPSTEYQE